MVNNSEHNKRFGLSVLIVLYNMSELNLSIQSCRGKTSAAAGAAAALNFVLLPLVKIQKPP